MTLTLSPLRYPQPFFAPKALDLLVIHMPSFGAGIVVSGPEPAAGMVLGVRTQPLSQRCVRIVGSIGSGFVALGGSVLPGHAAGEPFTDPQHALEVTNGRPPAFRA